MDTWHRVIMACCLALITAVVAPSAQAEFKPERCLELKAEAERYEAQRKYALLNETLRLRASECPTANAFFEAGIALIRVDAAVDSSDVHGSEPRSDQRHLLAMNYLEEALHRKDPPLAVIEARTAEFHIRTLQTKLTLIQLVPEDVREHYRLEIDGEDLPLTADRFWVTPGAHAVVLHPKAQGKGTIANELKDLRPGETKVFHVLEAPPVSSPSAEEKQAVAEPEKSTPEPVTTPPSHLLHRRLAVVGAATGAALAVIGVIAWTVAEGKTGDLEHRCAADEGCSVADIDDVRGTVRRLDRTSQALIPLGAVMAATGAGLAWWWWRADRRPPTALRADAWFGNQGGGLRVHGSF